MKIVCALWTRMAAQRAGAISRIIYEPQWSGEEHSNPYSRQRSQGNWMWETNFIGLMGFIVCRYSVTNNDLWSSKRFQGNVVKVDHRFLLFSGQLCLAREMRTFPWLPESWQIQMLQQGRLCWRGPQEIYENNRICEKLDLTVSACLKSGLNPAYITYVCTLSYEFPQHIPNVLRGGSLMPDRDKRQVKNAVFWDVTSCGSCKNRRFGGT
jgi:hypothetical protein